MFKLKIKLIYQKGKFMRFNRNLELHVLDPYKICLAKIQTAFIGLHAWCLYFLRKRGLV